MKNIQKIIHIDMDCFYAAIEIRDNPLLTNKPVAVGGQAERRGVLCTCNYVARQFGVHSAMPTSQAQRLCPDLIVLPVNMKKYKQESVAIHAIFKQFTEKIEPLSLDEAYLDVSDCTSHQGSATRIAESIRAKIQKNTGLTASAGVASNKCLAKIASDWHKPNGQMVIRPDDILGFMHNLPLRKLPGVGKVSEKKLATLGFTTCGELQQLSLDALTQHFNSQGARLFQLCRGIDDREVMTERLRKSVSVEETFVSDLTTLQSCLDELPALIDRLTERLNNLKNESKIHKQFVKVKFTNFHQTTVECLASHVDENTFRQLLKEAYSRRQHAVRLIGLGVRFHHYESYHQLLLFE